MSWVCPRRQGGQMGEVSRGLVVGIQQPKIPVQLQEKNGLGPRRPCHLVLNISAEAATLSWSFIHSYWVLPTCSVSSYLDMCFHCYFRFFKHTGIFFFFNQHSKIVFFFFFVGTRGPLPETGRAASQSPRQLLGHPQAALFPPLFIRF